MCDFSGKLIAWMDKELPADDAASVEQHLETCSECQSRLDAYKKVSAELDAYCDEVIAPDARRGTPVWIPAVSAVGAAAALVALFLILPRTRVEPPAFRPIAKGRRSFLARRCEGISSRDSSDPEKSSAAGHHAPQIQSSDALPGQNPNAYSLPEEPVIQIAIPADEMFPPGAVPEGMNFSADLAIAADGSADGLRLRPRLAGFERRTTQP